MALSMPPAAPGPGGPPTPGPPVHPPGVPPGTPPPRSFPGAPGPYAHFTLPPEVVAARANMHPGIPAGFTGMNYTAVNPVHAAVAKLLQVYPGAGGTGTVPPPGGPPGPPVTTGPPPGGINWFPPIGGSYDTSPSALLNYLNGYYSVAGS